MSEPIEPTLRRFLHRLVAAGEVTAAVALVAEGKEVLGWSAAGAVAPGEPEPPALTSRFDLASLTKPIMATLALILDRRGLLPLRARVGDVLPGAHPRLARRQLATLLRHRAGFVPWTLLARRCATPREVAAYLAAAPELLGAPPGTYSDLGYVLWGRLVETATGTPLARLLARHLAEPLAMTGLAASPAAGGDVVACGLDNGVEVELAAAQGLALAAERRWRRGEPQDANARFLGGLGGHAGLFGSAADLLRFARLWLDDGAGLLAGGRRRALAGGGPYALGWARRRLRGSAGRALPPAAFGHTGFTGGSLWLDPQRRRVYLLLAHRRQARRDFNPHRRAFHRLAAAAQSSLTGRSGSAAVPRMRRR